MNKTTTRIVTGLSLSALIIGLVFTPRANAQSNGTGQALEIGPPLISLSADPGQTIKATINIRDIAKTNLLVKGQINDFTASGEDGTPKIILDDTATSPYSLKSWLTPLQELTLKPKEIKIITIIINVPKDASPGGYYGVVRFTGTPPDLQGTGVSLAASLGSLILLKVNGEAKENLSIEQFALTTGNVGDGPSSLFQGSPITFFQRIKNNGNIQEEPTGLVTIKDMFGNIVATLPINQPPRDVLPQSIRKFEEKLDSSVIGDRFLFGLYHADLSVTYGVNKQTITSSLTFWVIPYTLITIVLILLVGGFFILRFFIIRYNRLIVSRATGTKPTKTPRKKKQ